MMPLDDDAELSRLSQEHNSALEAEMDQTDPMGIEPVDTVEALVQASRGNQTVRSSDPLESLDTEADDMSEIQEFQDDELEIKVSENLADFRDAVALAEINGLESIQASKKVIYHFTKPHYPKTGFFFYHGIRVDEAGRTEEINKHLAMTTEEAIFGRGR